MRFNLCHTLMMVLFGYTITAYNLEQRLPLYKRGPVNSTFGFSVTMHKTSNPPLNNYANSLLVIGSPTASALSSQLDTINPGGIFYCPVSTYHSDCIRVEMDGGRSTSTNNKTGQWLGVSIASQGEGKLLVTCSHRHASRSGNGFKESEILCGKCFLLNETSYNGLLEVTPDEIPNKRFIASPCQEQDAIFKSSYQNLAYSQSGVSVTTFANEYITGGPGAWVFSGAIFAASLNFTPWSFKEQLLYNSADKIFNSLGCSVKESEDEVSQCANMPVSDNSYMGFSVAASKQLGKYSANGTVFIAGAPTANFVGAVAFYKKIKDEIGNTNLAPIMDDVVMGELIGSSFGFSVIATDLNADGLDDLIVGAPQYYHYSNKGKYGGAVYIFFSDLTTPFSNITAKKFYGPLDSFFGHSLASLGDVDQDGYNDFAVGSPYESPSGKIHIFRGSAERKVKKSQVIDGARYVGITSAMKGFGISLSGNVDIDNNKYPDLLVGTLQDQAILFRARPTVKVRSSLSVDIKALNMTNPNCNLNGTKVFCFNIRYCITYKPTSDSEIKTLPISYKVILDSDRRKARLGSRVAFNSLKGVSVIKRKATLSGKKFCPSDLGYNQVYFKDNSEDRLSPITVDFKVSLEDDSKDISSEAPGKPIFQMINDPILDANYVTERKAVVNLANNCGNNGCQSNLKVDGIFPEEIFVATSHKVVLNLIVSNDGEDAYVATVSVKVPYRVYYINYTVSQSSGAKIACFASYRGGSMLILCSLGNPYAQNSIDNIDIYLDVMHLDEGTKEIEIEVTGSTASNNPEIPVRFFTSKILYELNLALYGYSAPQQIRYYNVPVRGESAINYMDEIGPLINYTFLIKNEGSRPARDVVLNVSFPCEINNGKWLLYLVSTNVSSGGIEMAGECSKDLTNPLNIDKRSSTSLSRHKRKTAAADKPPLMATNPSSGKRIFYHTLSCKSGTARCCEMNCRIYSILPGWTVSVFLKLRLWNYTFLEEFLKYDLVNVLTVAELSSENSGNKIIGNKTSQQVQTTVDHTFFENDVAAVFPWWYILIGVIVALIIYSVGIYLFIKCGYFKGKRFSRKTHENQEVLVREIKEQSL